jgi:hypothetical protein
MTVNIHNLIATINPEWYCDTQSVKKGKTTQEEVKEAVEKALKEGSKTAYLDVAKKNEGKSIIREQIYVDLDNGETDNFFDRSGNPLLTNPIFQGKFIRDASSQNLEQIYYWILEYMEKEYLSFEKITDNFTSSVSSGHFGEIGQRATRMQEEAMKMLGAVNQVIKSILNIVYDLKEFKIRLSTYDDLKSENKEKKDASILSLKQVWMDTVDMKRGNTAIKAMAQNYEYVTLIDAFIAAKSTEDVEKMDLNDRVKRILKPRLAEFERWITASEHELRKRFDLEKTYLKSQYNTVKLYARWIKPYMKAAKLLEQRANETAYLVNMFNTTLLELNLMGICKLNWMDRLYEGKLPDEMRKMNARGELRTFKGITIVEFKFTSIPERTDQRGGYNYRGRAEVVFTNYALLDDEIKVLKDQLEKDDLGDLLKLIEGATTESIATLQEDIDEFLNETPKKNEEKEESSDINPFSALFSFFSTKKEEDKEENKLIVKHESYYEAALRACFILKSRIDTQKIYSAFKSVYGNPSIS